MPIFSPWVEMTIVVQPSVGLRCFGNLEIAFSLVDSCLKLHLLDSVQQIASPEILTFGETAATKSLSPHADGTLPQEPASRCT